MNLIDIFFKYILNVSRTIYLLNLALSFVLVNCIYFPRKKAKAKYLAFVVSCIRILKMDKNYTFMFVNSFLGEDGEIDVFCGRHNIIPEKYSGGNVVFIKFHTDRSVTGHGFRMFYNAEG